MRFIIYKNSVLATVCSLFGAACMAMGVMGLLQGEIGILPAIAVIAVGAGLTWLAMVISDKKEQKKNAKRQAAAQNTYAQPTTAPRINSKPARKSLVFAGIFFLIAMLLALWGLHLYRASTPFFTVNSEQVALCAVCPLLAIAAFRTRRTQKVSILFAVGFLLMTLASVDVSLTTYRTYGFGGYTDSAGIHYAMALSHILKVAAYFLMTVFALFSMPKLKNRLGGIVKWLWFIPIPLLLLVYAKDISDSYILDLIKLAFEDGIRLTPRYDLLELAANFWVILAVFLSGFAFQRFCRNIESYVQPEPQYASPAPPQAGNRIVCPHCHQQNADGSVFCAGCGQRIVQPQPVRQAAPEPVRKPQPSPDANAQAAPKNVQKEMEAYKDLLDCGILTQEEYDQKIRELTRG